MIDLQQAVDHLAERDVGFLARHVNGNGEREVWLPASEVVTYAADPIAWWARHYGVTREQYLGWHQAGYRVQCSGRTVTGRQCRATVPAPHTIAHDPKVWVSLLGGYCSIHSERGSR